MKEHSERWWNTRLTRITLGSKWWCTTAFSHCHQNQHTHTSSIQTYSNRISGDVCKTKQHESLVPNQVSVFWFALSNQNKSDVRTMDHALYMVLSGYLFHTLTDVCICIILCVCVCVCVLHLTPCAAVQQSNSGSSWIPCRHGTGEAVNQEASKTAPWVDSRDGNEDMQIFTQDNIVKCHTNGNTIQYKRDPAKSQRQKMIQNMDCIGRTFAPNPWQNDEGDIAKWKKNMTWIDDCIRLKAVWMSFHKKHGARAIFGPSERSLLSILIRVEI